MANPTGTIVLMRDGFIIDQMWDFGGLEPDYSTVRQEAERNLAYHRRSYQGTFSLNNLWDKDPGDNKLVQEFDAKGFHVKEFKENVTGDDVIRSLDKVIMSGTGAVK